ncbi:MAG: MFS transporter [Bacteroidales bacterium]|nr:MFS transporter [Bacteroidales bacterium]MCB8998693.1 MFS transporter [Bacteroidales bacterium]
MMGVMGVVSITPAFPLIIDHFKIDHKKVGLLITVFTLPGIFLTPFLGILADLWGRKTVLVPSLFLFAIAGFMCSQADTFRELLLLRFIQGVGGASLGSLNVTLIGDIFTDRERATAMGYNASVLSIGTAAYPAIGGGLAMIAWNFPFYFPLMAIPLGLTVTFFLKTPHVKAQTSLLSHLRSTLKSLANKRVLGLFLLNILTFVILYGSYLTYFPVKLEESFGSRSLFIGLVLSSSSITTAITAAQLGKLTSRFNHERMLIISYSAYAISLILVPLMPFAYLMFIPAMIFGFAQGMNIPNIQTMLVTMAPIHHRAAFMSINGMVLRIGQTLGPLIAGMFYVFGGIRFAFFGGAILAGLMILLVVFTLSRPLAKTQSG